MTSLAPSALTMLAVLAQGPRTTRELREELSISNTAAYKNLIRLESDGYVEGHKVPSGGRPSFRFSITESGLSVLDKQIGTRALALSEELRTLETAKERVLAISTANDA